MFEMEQGLAHFPFGPRVLPSPSCVQRVEGLIELMVHVRQPTLQPRRYLRTVQRDWLLP